MRTPLFSETPPDRESYILGHAMSLSPVHWLDRLPGSEMWPPALDSLPRGKKWPQIDRRTLFSMAEEVTTPLAAVHWYIAVCAWGVGLGARNVARRVRVLRDTTNAGQRILEATTVLRSEGAVAGYQAYSPGGVGRMLGLGPGFWTKLLYFAGYDHASDDIQPLILDQYVVAGLNDVAALGWTMNWQWSAAQYGQYLALAASWAQEWNTAPDVVERALFERGKQVRSN